MWTRRRSARPSSTTWDGCGPATGSTSRSRTGAPRCSACTAWACTRRRTSRRRACTGTPAGPRCVWSPAAVGSTAAPGATSATSWSSRSTWARRAEAYRSRSVQAKPAPPGGVEVAGREPAGPAALVVLCGKVSGAGAGEEGLPDAGRVLAVARAPGSSRNVHHVAPALLVTDWRHAVDHVAVPPDRVTRPDVGDTAEGLHEERMPGLSGREDLVDRDAAHVVVGDVGQQRPQHEIGHGRGNRDGVQDSLVVVHVRQGGPALEGAEGRAHGRAGVLRPGGAVGGVPRVVPLDRPVEQVPERLLIRLGHPQVEGAGVQMGPEPIGVGARRPAADAVRVERVAVRVEPRRALGVVLPLAVEESPHPGHPVALAGLHLGPGPVDRVDLRPGAHGGEEVVTGTAVVLEERVALDVADQVTVPG